MSIHHIHTRHPYVADEWEREHRAHVERHGRKADACIAILCALLGVFLIAYWIAA